MTEATTTPEPRFGQVIIPPSGETDGITAPETIYFRLYDQGFYLHKPMVFGHGVVPAPKRPTSLPKFDAPGGFFHFTGPRLSATIIAQAVDFFRRILREKNSEAEVIVTQHRKTKEHRLFVPTQWVSRAGVRSLYNPEHISTDYLVIGTIHSHCDFSAYHSGTDEADARDMDGIHLTIGMLQQEQPQIAAMVAMNKVFWDYKPEDLADIDNLAAATAPAWWDRYVFNRQPTDDDRPDFVSDKDWDKIMGRTTYKAPTVVTQSAGRWVPQQTPRIVTPKAGSTLDTSTWTEDDWYIAEHWGFIAIGNGDYMHATDLPTAVYEQIFASRRPPMSEDLLPGGPAVPIDSTGGPATNAAETEEEDDDDAAFAAAFADYWEDILGKEYVDSLYDNDLISISDEADVFDHPDESLTREWWEKKVKGKMFRAYHWLRAQGYDISLKVNKGPDRPLPGQTEAFPQLTTGQTNQTLIH